MSNANMSLRVGCQSMEIYRNYPFANFVNKKIKSSLMSYIFSDFAKLHTKTLQLTEFLISDLNTLCDIKILTLAGE